MKKTNLFKGLMLGGVLLSASMGNAQNSNPWPTSGNVGIGTNSPSYPLHVLINQAYNSGTNPYPTGLKLQNAAGGTRIGLDFLTYGTSAEPARVARIEAIDMGSFTGDLAFYTKNSTTQSDINVIERMRISAGGNVGIGIASPTSKLHVGGQLTVENNQIQVNPGVNAGWVWLGAFGKASMTMTPTVAAGGNWHHIHNDAGNLRFSLGANPNNTIPLTSNLYNYMSISNSGNVGIGVSVPTNSFEARGGGVDLMTGNNDLGSVNINGVATNWGTNAFATSSNKGSANLPLTGFAITKGSNGTTSPIVWMYGGGNLNNAFQVRSVGWNDASLSPSKLLFQVRSDGKTTIGSDCFPTNPTTNQPYTLGVAGDVLCTSLRVRTKGTDCNGWGDFVFDSNYNLSSLQSVEEYINKNKHLPGIPSAKEVETNGIEIEEMIRLQMIKIEELTLHMIELKKENEFLKSQFAGLSK